MDEDLSRAFGLTDGMEDADLDIEAIFQADADPADTLPPVEEAEPVPAATADENAGPTEPQEPAAPDGTPDEEQKDAETKAEPPADTAPEQDIFAAFAADNAAPPAPKLELAPSPAGQVSIFDKPPVFSYGGHKDKIEDASQTFEELRIKKADDFPELEDGKTVSWKVKYGDITKSVANPKETTIATLKEEIEKSKVFLDALKKGKIKEPDCLVIPTVVAKSKGTLPDYKGVFPTAEAARASDKLICLLPARDGRIYEMRKTEMGEFVALKDKVVDFAEVRAGFSPALPLIPQELMGQIISFFRYLMNKTAEYEALVYIYWDRQEEKFTAFVPKQAATKASVHTAMTGNTLPEDRYLLYADVHSHNSMPAKFSPVDDKDEKATRLYVVIGNLNRFFPSVTARVSCGGTYMTIDPHLVMESVGEEFPPDWLDQVERIPISEARYSAPLDNWLYRGMER